MGGGDAAEQVDSLRWACQQARHILAALGMERTFFLSNKKAIYNIMHNDKGQLSICSQV